MKQLIKKSLSLMIATTFFIITVGCVRQLPENIDWKISDDYSSGFGHEIGHGKGINSKSSLKSDHDYVTSTPKPTPEPKPELIPEPTPEPTVTPLTPGADTEFYMQLTPTQVDTYDFAEFVILRKISYAPTSNPHGDGYYTFFTSFGVELSDDGMLKVNFNGKALKVMEGGKEEAGFVTFAEIERTDLYTRYEVLTILLGNDTEGGWLGVELDNRSGEVTILSMTSMDHQDLAPEDRPEVNIFDTWTIAFPSYERIPGRDNSGNVQPYLQWERPGNMIGWELIVEFKEIDIIFLMSELDPAYEYYYFFNITDTAGNVTTTEMSRILLQS